jgi:hypothetical protein
MSDQRTYGLGRLYVPDERDQNYPLRAMMTKKPERRKRPWNRPRVLDQGATGTCVGHAWRLWLEMAPRLHPPEYGVPAFDIYRAAVLLDEWRQNDGEARRPDDDLQFGTSVRAGAKVMQQLGAIGEYRWAYDAATIADFVTRRDGSPVVVGTNWYEGMMRPDPRSGRISLGGSVVGGHAWLVRWFNERDMVFTGVSSWGRAWGLDGQFFIRYEDLDRLVKEQGEACCGVELATRTLADPVQTKVTAKPAESSP